MGNSNSSGEGKRRAKYELKRLPGVVKYKLTIYIPREQYEKLDEVSRRLFPEIHRGRISLTVQRAIDFFIAYYLHSDTRRVNPRPTTQELARAIQEQIRFEHGHLAPDIPHRVLRQYIMYVRRIKTPRHADSWAYKMYIEGIIKPRRGENKIKPEWIHDDVIWEWVMVL